MIRLRFLQVIQRQSKYCCSVSISDLEINSQSNTGLPYLAGTASMCSDCRPYNIFVTQQPHWKILSELVQVVIHVSECLRCFFY